MSILLRHVTLEHQGLRLVATGDATRRGLPRTFPFSATWACRPLGSLTNDYHTLFAFGPASFSGADYYTAAVVIGGSNPLWSFGMNGSDNTNSGTSEILVLDRWYYQGFRIMKDTVHLSADFYYDLPDRTKVIHYDSIDFGSLSSAYFDVVGSTTFFGVGDVQWADHETFEGYMAGFKMWQSYLSETELLAESQSAMPVIPHQFNALWDLHPFKTNYDHSLRGIQKINNRRWSYPNVVPITGTIAPFQRNASRWYWDVWAPASVPLNAYTLTAAPGSYAVTGTAATLKAARQLLAAGSSYALTGTAAALRKASALAATGGAFGVTGSDATLTHGLGSSFYRSTVLADGPSLYLRLGESSGTAAVDSSGNGLHGVYQNTPTLGASGALTGDPNTAVTLNGTDEYITVADNALLNPGDVFTLEAWVYLSSYPAGVAFHFINKGTNGYVLACVVATGVLRLAKSGVGAVIGESPTAIPLSRWSHIVATKNGATVHFYINGVDVGVNIGANSTITTSVMDLHIGRSAIASTNFVNGSLDEVAIYPTALSAARVQAHYNAGVVGSYTVAATSGAFALAGTAATLTVSRRLTASPGAFLITGTAASLTAGAAVMAEVRLSESLVSRVALSEALAYRVALSENVMSRVAVTESLIG